MLTEAAFAAEAADLARLNGIPEDLAAKYLAEIGDTPELDGDDRAIVRDAAGVEIARVRLA